MKKLFLLFAVVVLAFSFGCSDDDDDDPKQDPIIGVWKPVKDVEVYTNGTEDIYLPTACELKNRYTFRADGTFSTTDFPESNDGNCEELVGNLYLSGEWEKLSDSKYKFTYICYIPGCDETMVEIPDEVKFSNSNNTIIVTFNETDLTDDVEYYYTELSRVE